MICTNGNEKFLSLNKNFSGLYDPCRVYLFLSTRQMFRPLTALFSIPSPTLYFLSQKIDIDKNLCRRVSSSDVHYFLFYFFPRCLSFYIVNVYLFIYLFSFIFILFFQPESPSLGPLSLVFRPVNPPRRIACRER